MEMNYLDWESQQQCTMWHDITYLCFYSWDHRRYWTSVVTLPTAFFLLFVSKCCSSSVKSLVCAARTLVINNNCSTSQRPCQVSDLTCGYSTWTGFSQPTLWNLVLMWNCSLLCKKQRIKNNWCNILNWTGNVSEALGILVSLLPRYPPQ